MHTQTDTDADADTDTDTDADTGTHTRFSSLTEAFGVKCPGLRAPQQRHAHHALHGQHALVAHIIFVVLLCDVSDP